jgi:hypothetical protein
VVCADGETALGNNEGPDMHGLGGEHPEGVLGETPVQTAALIAVQLGSYERTANVSLAPRRTRGMARALERKVVPSNRQGPSVMLIAWNTSSRGWACSSVSIIVVSPARARPERARQPLIVRTSRLGRSIAGGPFDRKLSRFGSALRSCRPQRRECRQRG